MHDNHPKECILLVNQTASDRKIFEKIFRENYPYAVVNLKPMKARRFLEKTREFKNSFYPMPVLIILDLQLPGNAGLQLLEACKNHSQTKIRELPIMILTYPPVGEVPNLPPGAAELWTQNCFTKPMLLDDFTTEVKRLIASQTQ